MGRRKGLHITSTSFIEGVEDHGEDEVEYHDTYDTQSHHTSKIQGCQSNYHVAQGPMANKKNKNNQCLNGEATEYLKIRELRVQENNQRLRDIGVTNIVSSLKSLAQSQEVKNKTVKQSTQDGDVDFVPDPGDDSEEDCQQVARGVVVSKKQHRRQYISPMCSDRVVNLNKLRRVVAPNVPKKAPSTSNALKPSRKRPVGNLSDEGLPKRSMSLIDEENDEIFQGNRVDMEVNNVNQHEDHGYSEDEDNIQELLQGPAKQKSTGSNSKGNRTGRHKRLHITSTVSNDHTEGHVDDNHDEDHQVSENQGHQTSEIQGSPKKIRGYTQKKEIWDMEKTQRIGVTFNKYGKPIGDEGNELVQFLGTLVRMAEHVSIEYSDWRKVPVKNKENMYKIVKSKFGILPNETNEIKQWIFHSMGRKWKAWKGSLKACAYDSSLTVDEIVAKQVNSDKRVNPTQFKKLVTRWFTPEFQRTCDDKRSSRSKMKEPHVSGTKSFARLTYEMATENDGVYPTRGEVYIKTRTRKDGTIVDDKAAHVVASLKDIANDSTITPCDPDDYTNDDYSKVKGSEKRGYVRLLGKMPTAKSNVAPSVDSQHANKIMSAVSAMAIIIQEHIPNANLSSVLSNLNIEVPGISSLVHNNSTMVNEMSSSRSHNVNGQERHLDN